MTLEEQVRALVKDGRRPEAIRLLEERLKEKEEDEDLWLYAGELIYAEGRMADALNKFNAVLRLNPANQKARNYVTMINNILGYFCKDLLNP